MFNASFNAAETLDADLSTPVQPIAQPSNENLKGSNSVQHFMHLRDGTMIEIV